MQGANSTDIILRGTVLSGIGGRRESGEGKKRRGKKIRQRTHM